MKISTLQGSKGSRFLFLLFFSPGNAWPCNGVASLRVGTALDLQQHVTEVVGFLE